MDSKARQSPSVTPSQTSLRISQRDPSKNRLSIQPIIAFYIFVIPNLLAAFFSPIQDCDEVFNYWEPTHYLNRGYGLQTWEYSPEFSIRSWAYIVIHAIVGKFGSLFSSDSRFEFYFIRAALAVTCAYCETRMFSTISRTLNPRIGVVFMIVMITSPGVFHASVAYLPSSFAMYTSMLGTAAFLDWRFGSKTAQGIMWFGLGSTIGWPFASVLIVPFIFEEALRASITQEGIESLRRCLDGTVRSILILTLQVAIDTFFYHKLVAVPWQIVSYNVFSSNITGPEIFGTEPWDFYIRNLLLNFNVWFLLAILAGPALALQYIFRGHSMSKFTLLRTAISIIPFYMWLFIFSIQAHKEERFMYPAYPFLGLNAAIALNVILTYVGSSNPTGLVGKVPASVKLALMSVGIILAVDIGLLRTLGSIQAYQAPMQIYASLQASDIARPGEVVCLGKEWYRFPSSYFLPKGMRVKFIKSAFDGLLPGEFNEAKVGFGVFAGTWLIPAGMNDQNVADPGKYIDVAHCSFLVDSFFPAHATSPEEPEYILDSKTWEPVQCASFLDAPESSLLARVLWIPDLGLIPERYRRRWGEYCLLRRRGIS